MPQQTKANSSVRSLLQEQLETSFTKLLHTLEHSSRGSISLSFNEQLLAFARRARQVSDSGNEVGLITCIHEASMLQETLAMPTAVSQPPQHRAV